MGPLVYPSRSFVVVRHGVPQVCGGLAEGAILAYLLFRAEGGYADEPLPDVRIAEYTGVAQRSVRRGREALARLGFLRAEYRAGRGHVYALQYPEIQAALDLWARGVPSWLL